MFVIMTKFGRLHKGHTHRLIGTPFLLEGNLRMEHVHRIVRIDPPAIGGGDCGKHPFKQPVDIKTS